MRLALVLLIVGLALALSRFMLSPTEVESSPPRVTVPGQRTSVAKSTPVPAPEMPALSALPAHFFGEPEKPEAMIAAERASERPDFALVGLLGAGDVKRGVFRLSDGRSEIARANAQIGDWRVEAFADNCATLRRAKRTAKLCL